MTVLRYGKHPSQVVEVDGSRGPLIVMIHGGYWRSRYDRRYLRPLAQHLVGEGYRTALVEYRRLGEVAVGWRATFDDILSAYDAVAATADPGNQPFVAGHSAGGQLALWLASQRACRGVVAWAPVADLHLAADQHLSDDAVVALLGGTPAEVPDRYEAVSPTRGGAPRSPTLIVHGTADQAVPSSQSENVAAIGATTERHNVNGADHFDVIDPSHECWQVSSKWFADH